MHDFLKHAQKSNLAHLQVESTFITLLHVYQLIFPSCAKKQLMNVTLEGCTIKSHVWTDLPVLTVYLGHMQHDFGLITCLPVSLKGQPMHKTFEWQHVEETDYSSVSHVNCMLGSCCFVQPYAKLALDLHFQPFPLMSTHCNKTDMASHLVCKLNKAQWLSAFRKQHTGALMQVMCSGNLRESTNDISHKT